MRRKWMGTVLAIAVSASFAMSAFAGEWGQDEKGFWYKNDSGSYAREQKLNIDGATYGFDQQAYMVTGWRQFDGSWSYFEPGSGAMATGWKQLGEEWYYLNPGSGAMQISWIQIGSSLYHFKEDGTMQKANTRFYVNNFAYETGPSGAVKRNTSEDKGDGRIFIFESDGRMKYTNSTLKDGNRAAGTDTYVYLLEGDLNEQTKNDTKQAITEAVDEKKEMLYEEYRKEVRTETRTKRHATKLEKWKLKVNRVLGELKVAQAEIDEYINAVIWGRYGEDNGEYKYWYDEDYEYDEDYYNDSE